MNEENKPQPSEEAKGKTAVAEKSGAVKEAAGAAKKAPGGKGEEKRPQGAGKPAAAPRRGGQGAVWFVLLLVAAGAGAGGYYLWQQLQGLQSAQTKADEALAQRLTDQKTAIARLSTALDQTGQSIAAGNKERDALRASLEALRARLGQSRRDWAEAEVEYLLIVANRRLQLEKDVGTALAALEAADAGLLRQGDPAFLPVREEVSREIQALRGVPRVDIAGTAMELASLAASVDQLPLAGGGVSVPAAEAAAPASEPAPRDWKAMAAALWHEIKGLVTIRRAEREAMPLLAPNERFFLRENLRLKLETARLALLGHKAAVYRSTLEEAAAWLNTYFDDHAQPVLGARQTLERLAGLDIDPKLPDISASLRTLRRIARQTGIEQPGGQEESAQ